MNFRKPNPDRTGAKAPVFFWGVRGNRYLTSGLAGRKLQFLVPDEGG